MVIMLSIHPRRHDIVGTETIVADPDVSIRYYHDPSADAGRLLCASWWRGARLRGDALVRDLGLPDAHRA